MGLLSDFYNTVARFFRPQEEHDDASKSVATNRLKLVLMQDRTNLTPKVLEQMRGELVDLLSKYLEMDKELLELNFEQEGDQVALMLSIPVIRAKDEDEIDGLNNEENEEDDDSSSENESEDNENEAVDENDVEASCEEGSELEAGEIPSKKKVSKPKEMKSSKKEDESEEVKEECASEN